MNIKSRKIKIIILWGVIWFMIFSLMACGSNKGKRYSLSDVAENSTFDITMKSYSGTAYVWSYEISPSSGIEYVSLEFISDQEISDWIGGGKLKYTFRAVQAGNYKIKFEARILSDSKQTSPIESNIYEIIIVKSK